jgi:DNA recombination protein RmuC
MGDTAIWVVLALGVINAVLLVLLLVRMSARSDGEGAVRDELRTGREEAARAARESREELTASLNTANTTLSTNLTAMGEMQKAQLDTVSSQLKVLSESNSTSLERIRVTVDSRVKELQEGNEKKLDEMRMTVDEKLHDTLEKRLGESFKLVSERLEAVQRGLGEMQSLATGVGDLKRVLTNVKARGTWAEVQLGALLEQVLTPAT